MDDDDQVEVRPVQWTACCWGVLLSVVLWALLGYGTWVLGQALADLIGSVLT